MDLKKMSTQEIKALVYDLLSQRDVVVNNIQFCQNELNIRLNNPEVNSDFISDMGDNKISTIAKKGSKKSK